MKIGSGFDVHKLVEGRPLIIGGVTIPFEKGLDGHSDADVLLHAVMDALLGAVTLKDIGYFFPPDDPKYEGASSMKLLKTVEGIISGEGYRVGNLDCTIIAQNPKMAPYIDDMRVNIARVLKTNLRNVNIKATTTEGLGFTGKGEGIAAFATVLLEELK